jgi:hypothetical protein
MKRSNGESIPKRERMFVLKKDLVAAYPAENALCNLHPFILPGPTQARNSMGFVSVIIVSALFALGLPLVLL